MLIVPQNASAPTTLSIRFKSPVFGPDLTSVTAITAGLLRRDGTQTVLTFAIVSATTRELLAQYTFAGGELTTTGAYYLAPLLAVPGGSVPSETIPLFVAGPFNAIPQLEQDAWLMATVPMPSLGPTKSAWQVITGNTTASPYGPFVALDLRTGSFTLTLWHALDGDTVYLSDVYGAAATHPFTIAGAAGQKVPVGDGTYATSAVYNAPNFSATLKYNAASGNWFPVSLT